MNSFLFHFLVKTPYCVGFSIVQEYCRGQEEASTLQSMTLCSINTVHTKLSFRACLVGVGSAGKCTVELSTVPSTDYDIQLVEILPSSIRQALFSQAEFRTVQRLSKVVWNSPVREGYKLVTLNI